MSKDRIIHLLTDEEISYILTGLRTISSKYKQQNCNEDASFCDFLFDKIDKSLDVGVIGNERI